MIDSAFFILIATIFIVLIASILKGPTLWDRVLAANLFTSMAAMTIVLYSVVTDIAYLIDVALVFVLVGFVGTQFYAVFISRFGRL